VHENLTTLVRLSASEDPIMQDSKKTETKALLEAITRKTADGATDMRAIARHFIQLAALACLVALVSGCAGAAVDALHTARTVASTSAEKLNKIEPTIERSYRQGLKACLWDPNGQKSPAPLATQEACVDQVEVRHKGATSAYEAAAEVVTSAETVILTAEAALAAGHAPSLDKFLRLAEEVIAAIQKLDAAQQDLRRPFATPAPGATP
jgi:hypothetical protein